jgi:UDP-N-acetylmuramoylalanine--D-glutamate ligase
MKVPWGSGRWRRVVVYGLGVSGGAAVRLLRSREVEVVVMDRRPQAELPVDEWGVESGVELVLGQEPESLPEQVDGVVVSPGVPMDRPLLQAARQAGLPVIAEVELAFPFLQGPVVALTGSNGKSTTTELTGALLRSGGHRVEICGNIGEPLSGRIEGPADRLFVVELSSFQLEGVVTFRPRAAALLNVSPDHLDRYPDLATYAAAKQAIFSCQEEKDLTVLNADDPLVAKVASRARRRFFSSRRQVHDGCFLDGDRVLEVVPGEPLQELFWRSDLILTGSHNLENAMAAALLARCFGVEPAQMRTALGAFGGLEHRLQRVGEWRGVVFYDDSKGTNTAATARSLEGFRDGSVHLILGGRAKGADPAVLEPWVEKKARRLYLIGEAAGEFERALSDVTPCEVVGTLEKAVRSAVARAQAEEVILLSPACASFDQYSSYGERGRHFQRLVADLSEDTGGQEAGV